MRALHPPPAPRLSDAGPARSITARRSRLKRLAGVAMLATALPVAPAAAQEAAPPDIVERLRAVPGLVVVSEQVTPAPPAPYRAFVLTYRQPVDHARPWHGSFDQRLTLLFRSDDRPMVLHSTGYNVRMPPARGEATRLLEANQISVEHRFFSASRPDPADWTKLDIWQAASDHHRIVEALEPVFPTRWISTGTSKGGMATVYHRRFYPFDVDGTIAYVAPNNVDDRDDRAYDAFLARVGTDPSCRERLNALQQEALGVHRAELLDRFTAWAAANGQTFHGTLGSAERAFEYTILDTPFTFWQVRSQAACPDVPAAPASTDAIYAFIDATVGWGAYTDQGTELYIPYFHQAATQLGYPSLRFTHLRKAGRYRKLYDPRSFLPGFGVRADHRAMADVDDWVRHQGSELVFVYGENDPWSVERFELGRGSRDSSAYVAAGSNHAASVARLTLDEQAAVTATLQRWAAPRPH